MKLNAQEYRELVDSLSAEDLDELIHQEKSREASVINNEGVVSQLRYLATRGYSKDEILGALKGAE